MLVTRDFVLVHVPKTGGTFLNRLVHEYCEVLYERGHSAYAKLPADYHSLPAMGFVRNPWEWYVSWFEHMQRVRPEPHQVSPIGYREVMRGNFKGFLWQAFNAPQLRGYDLYSDLVRGYLNGCETGQTECLADDFTNFLRRHGVNNPSLAKAVRTSPPVNLGRHRPFQCYYCDEDVDLVSGSWVAQTYGYCFEPLPEPELIPELLM